MSNFLAAGRAVTFTVNASDKIASWSRSGYTITKVIGYPNVPPTLASVYNGTDYNTTSAFTLATTIIIQAGTSAVFWETGTGPVIPERANLEGYLGTPGTLNATGTLTAALILGGVVTSTTGAAVVATLDTGAAMDIAIDMSANEAFEWTAINTGASNAFTVTASSGHTIVGAGAVALSSSGRFLTRRTAADTYVTYRLS